MDWDYITSLSLDNLTDEEKDGLFHKVTWFDVDNESFLTKDIVVLFKIAQEILKYKSIQVESLLSELDEIAAQQGEQEARKFSDSEAQSLQSKRSGSLDLEELETKYANLKQKNRKLLKALDKLNSELKDLKQRNKLLESDRLHLQNELQTEQSHQNNLNDNESASDVSEIVRDRQKELIENLHQKNGHISKLLDDIEIVENDNIILREKLTNVKHELKEGTEQLNLTISELTTCKFRIEEMQEIISLLKDENDALKIKEQDMVDEKIDREKQIDDYSHEIEARVDKWKEIIDSKNKELQQLKSKLNETDLIEKLEKSSSNSSFTEGNPRHIETEVLQKVILERECQILQLRTEIQSATVEMDATVFSLTKLKNERNLFMKKNDDLVDLVKDLKSQLKGVHSRCQELQQLLSFAENAAISKDADLKTLIAQIKDSGKIELADLLTETANMKNEILSKDKEISILVRTTNKLQKNTDRYLKENITLRERLGLSKDDHVGIKLLKSDSDYTKKSKRATETVKLFTSDEQIKYRLEIENLTKSVGSLVNQVISLGEKPNYDGDLNSILAFVEHTKNSTDIEDMIEKTKYEKVVEENEALRKGLHEILNSVQENETDNLKEIKSQTLEQLLLALDAKHISGWYHPAMRLQAELHTIQGVNSELREQLRNAKLELDEYKKHSFHFIDDANITIFENLNDSSNADIIQYLKNHIFDILNSFKSEEEKSSEVISKLEDYRKDFLVIQHQLSILYQRYSKEKDDWIKGISDDRTKIAELEEKVEVLHSKLKIAQIFTGENTATEEEKLKKFFDLSENFIIANRKCLFLQDNEVKYLNEIDKFRQNFMNLQQNIEISEDKINKNKATTNETLETNNVPLKMQKESDEIIKKYRNLLAQFETCTETVQKESELLNSIIEMQKKEKQEVADKLFDTLHKLNAFENSYCSVDKAIENLTKKLAQSEVNELTEKQRADHTNNLYELVKEQLKKSEERLVEKDKSIEDLKNRHLLKQDELNDLQDKVTYFVDAEVHKDLKNICSTLEKRLAEISNELATTKLNLKLSNAKLESGQLWSNSDEYTLLSLKHQIVDLQALSDDKAIIARLSSDVVAARLAEAEMQNKLNLTLTDVKDLKVELEERLKNQNITLEKSELIIKGFNRRNEFLEDVLRKLKREFYGFVPLATQSRFIENVYYSLRQKHKILETLQKTKIEQQCCFILKEQLAKEIENIEELKAAKDLKGKYPPLLNWYQERNYLQLQEIKYKRQSEYMDHQLEQANKRIKQQDNHILKLEEELLNNPEELLTKMTYSPPNSPKNSSNTISSESTISKAKILKCSETQTYFEFEGTAKETEKYENNLNVSLQNDLSEAELELGGREKMIEELKTKIKELEVNINLFKTQLGDKQSQITFYEKHIVELQTKKEELANDFVIATTDGSTENERTNLQTLNHELKARLQEKDAIILNLQTLLKQDRDEHSLAAARMQNELKRLYDIVNVKKSSINDQNTKTNQQQSTDQQQKGDDDSTTEPTSKAIVEQYILQVHVLEKHTTDLHTAVSTLTAQLQISREEAVRWRALANDRLAIMEQLGKEYDRKNYSKTMTENHKEEISNYKRDADKWRQEVVTLNKVITKHRDAFYNMKAEVENHRLEDKDSRIHELTLKLRQQQSEFRKKIAISVEDKKFEEHEMAREQLTKEHEMLKKRFEQLINRERSGREELRALKAQVMKRPTLSARSDSNTSTQQIQQQSQRKIKTLQDEIDILQEKLQQQSAIIDSHRVKVSMDFEKWTKQKHYQQLSEKLKQKLKDKQVECERLLEMNSGFRIMFERSEKEKHNLDARIKNLKSQSASSVNIQKYEVMVLENTKLLQELDIIKVELNTQHHHSGGLGAAVLQEKLDAKERKLAIMEVSAKGTLDVRLELERLGSTLNSVQKSNLRLEAENLELKLNLEHKAGEVPHLKEQIVHLENYITALKTEQTQEQLQITGSGDHNRTGAGIIMTDAKKIQELDRTVAVLQRVVDKLQAENKKLAGASLPCSDRSDHSCSDRYRRDYYILKDLHIATTRKLSDVQTQLDTANGTIKHLSTPVTRKVLAGNSARPHSPLAAERPGVISCQTCFLLQGELNRVNEQLAHKAELLEKVKVLLQKAAAKEKGLLHEVANLKSLIPVSSSSPKVD